ncbi:MAG: dTDP-glucose 4,6-dehydratase [Gammaproteobacteria bacterium]|nr:dTDP-glucose 4,6-dehydratase [Gammaproteobacteria bacterium]
MSTILVTGGAGFIGSSFVRHWLAHHANDRVVNYDLLTYAACPASLDDVVEREGDRYAFVQGDIRDYDLALATIRGHAVDVIVNFAAESHNSRAVVQPETFFTTNVVGTVQLMRAALEAGVSRFHHVSTCEVYGDLPLDADDTFVESSPFVPKTPYNASKAAADLAVNAFFETYGLPATISNCANNYGPYQFPEKVIPHFVVSVLNGKPMTLYRGSRNRREWLHVDDHCRAIETIIERGRLGEMYNVGSGLEVDIEGIADRILEVLNADPALKSYVPDRPGHDRRYLLDSSKIRSELGWQPRIDFEAGFEATVHWYRDNVHWWRGLLDRVVVDETGWQDDPEDVDAPPKSSVPQAGAIA